MENYNPQNNYKLYSPSWRGWCENHLKKLPKLLIQYKISEWWRTQDLSLHNVGGRYQGQRLIIGWWESFKSPRPLLSGTPKQNWHRSKQQIILHCYKKKITRLGWVPLCLQIHIMFHLVHTGDIIINVDFLQQVPDVRILILKRGYISYSKHASMSA